MGRLPKTQQLEISLKLKDQTILWKYQQKEHKKYKGSSSTWIITSKPEPVYPYKRHAYIKKHVHQIVSWVCLGFTLPLSTVHMN